MSADPTSENPGLGRLAELAEHIATEIGMTPTDWCTLAQDARALADGLAAFCQGSRD